jgi:hypothetical protein
MVAGAAGDAMMDFLLMAGTFELQHASEHPRHDQQEH